MKEIEKDIEKPSSAESITSDVDVCPKPPSAEKQRFEASLKDLTREVSVEEINDILSLTIKHDDTTKAITFLTYLLTYTKDNQINLCFKSESARGKSYIALEIAKYFPENDVWIIGYASPTAFFHTRGIPVFEGDGETENRRFSHYLVDLSKKILIFLDQPNNALLERLRPLLSHDKKEYESHITDRSEKYGLRTKKVVIIGFPTVAFCTSKMKTNPQEQTRVILLSPEATQEKLELSTRLVGLREAHRAEFEKLLEDDPKRKWLIERVDAVKTASIENVDIIDESEIWQHFRELHKTLQPRHQRDYQRLIALIKAHALLNSWNRKQHIEDYKTIIASDVDIEAGFKLYHQIYKSNELGLPPEIWEIWTQVIEPLLPANDTGIHREQIHRAYYKAYHRTLSDERLRRVILTQLEGAGLIILEKDPVDRRKTWIKKSIINHDEEIYVGEGGGKIPYPTSQPHISSFNSPSLSSQEDTEKAEKKVDIDIQSVLSVKALDPVTQGNCPICKKKDVSLVWQVLFMDGSRYDAVCMDCGGDLQEKLNP